MRSRLLTTQKIVQTAAELFLDRGYHNVSMDLIADTAGISKITVYQHFQSKEHLLLHCMRWRLESREASLDLYFRDKPLSQSLVLELFDWMAERANKAAFPGCAFLKATTEMGATVPEVQAIALEAKHLIRTRLATLLSKTAVPCPEQTADTLALLLEGAQALSLIEQSNRPFKAAKREATGLVLPFTMPPAGAQAQQEI